MSEKSWHLYLIQCADQSLYTGIATDVQRRFSEHQAQGRLCARYLRGRAPLQLMYSCAVADRSTALKLEYRVKQLSRNEKRQLIQGELTLQALMPVASIRPLETIQHNTDSLEKTSHE